MFTGVKHRGRQLAERELDAVEAGGGSGELAQPGSRAAASVAERSKQDEAHAAHVTTEPAGVKVGTDPLPLPVAGREGAVTAPPWVVVVTKGG